MGDGVRIPTLREHGHRDNAPDGATKCVALAHRVHDFAEQFLIGQVVRRACVTGALDDLAPEALDFIAGHAAEVVVEGKLLGPEVTDVDGNTEDRGDTISVFNGPPPTIRVLSSESEEIKAVADWMAEQAKAGVQPHEFGIFVRSPGQLDRARAAVKEAGLVFKILDEHVETTSGHVSIGTMHLAKGLEFRAVVVMACDDEVIPLQERIETVGDDADLQEVYDTERHLLYVACTRARDHLLITGIEPASEFIDDLRM